MWNDFDQSNGGGGYFLNNTENNVDSPAADKKKNARRLQSVVPVVVRQIRDCEEDEFKLFGMPTQILHIVGILRECNVQSTKATYSIEDHTGMIKAIWWLENDSDTTPVLPPVKEGSYVQIFGSLRNQDNEKIMMVLRMFLVDDCNLITNHLLQVIHTRLQAEYSSKNQGTMIKANNPGANLTNSMSFMNGHDSDRSDGIVFSNLQEKILKIIRADSSAAGTSLQKILQSFPPNQHKEIHECMTFLVQEGHAYSTIDSEHYKSTSDA